jgi:hypothetical protein
MALAGLRRLANNLAMPVTVFIGHAKSVMDLAPALIILLGAELAVCPAPSVKNVRRSRRQNKNP